MNYLKEESSRAAAIEYIRRQLSHGKSLAKLLLGRVDLKKGYVVTLSSSLLTPTEAMQFDCGHALRTQSNSQDLKIQDADYIAVPTPNANAQLIAAIRDTLQRPRRVCLLENAVAEAHDSWLHEAKSLVVTNGNEVYHALFSADPDKSKIEDAIREWFYLPASVGVLGNMSQKTSAQIASTKNIIPEQLAAFAETAESVFVGAYDGEGYVVWTGSG